MKIICILIAFIAFSLPVITSARVIRTEPVPLYGTYDMYLDRSKQTFNDHPTVSNRPLTQIENFTTHCDAKGCLARSTNKRPPPDFFEYHWANGQWESVAGQQHQYLVCNDGSKVDSIKFDIIKPVGDGSFSGERMITVGGSGCPGDGPGKYSLPFTLTPAK